MLVRKPQYPFGIGGSVTGDDLQRFVSQGRQCSNHLGEVFRQVVFVAVAGKGDVGGIGLDHKRLRWQFGGGIPDPSGTVIGDGAANGDDKAELYELARLLLAAVEGMDNPAMGECLSSECCKDLVVGLADMEENWQVGAGGYLQLPLKELLLDVSVKTWDMVVKAYLADCHNTAPGHQSLKLLQMLGTMVSKVHGVQAGGGEEALILASEVHDPLPPSLVNPRHDHFLHTRPFGSGHQLLEAAGKLADINMTMGVDEFHGEAFKHLSNSLFAFSDI